MAMMNSKLSFKLGIPNREVNNALYNQLLAHYSQQAEQVKTYRQDLFKAFKTANFQAIQQQIESLFAGYLGATSLKTTCRMPKAITPRCCLLGYPALTPGLFLKTLTTTVKQT
jgi:hypothetical protein